MTNQEINVKPTEMKHVEGLRTCLDVVARERRYIGFLEAPPREMTESFVSANIRDGAPQFVALDGSNVVGWCDVRIHSLEGFRHVGTLGMGILPEYRGRGIGSRLVQATLTSAWERGLTRVELDVFESNLPARRLYEKLGFQTEGVKRNARFLDGKYENVMVMAKLEDEDPSNVADQLAVGARAQPPPRLVYPRPSLLSGGPGGPFLIMSIMPQSPGCRAARHGDNSVGCARRSG